MRSSAGGGPIPLLRWSSYTTASGRACMPGGERGRNRCFLPNPLQHNGERAALAFSRAEGRDGSSMLFDDGLCNRQPESRATWTLPSACGTGARACLVSAIETGEKVPKVGGSLSHPPI